MKYLVVILIIVLLFLVLKNDISEKFNQELTSPEVLEVRKIGDAAIIKFKNKSKKERKFMIFYIDTETPQSGIWVEKQVNCDKEICEFTLSDLVGSRYHLVIVETDGQNMSSINRIIKFGDGNSYTPYQIIPSISQDINIIDNKKPFLETQVISGQESFKKDEEEEVSDSPTPYVECGRNPKVKFVEDKTDMDDIEINSSCEEDNNIPKIRKKVSRSLWDEFKKGYLSVDFNLVN